MANKVAAVGIAAVGLAIFLFVGFYVVDASIQNSRHDISITNESFTPSAGTVHSFNNSDLERAEYDDTVTVRNATSDAILTESGNYTWFPGNGTLKTLSGGDLASASQATISYDYTGQTLEQTATTNIVIDLMGTVVPIAFVGFVALLMVGTAVLGRAA